MRHPPDGGTVEGTFARTRTTALTLVSAALLLPGSALAKGGAFDMGDAVDEAGRFPARLASAGPRHGGLGELRLGKRVDGESDSEQVDKDRYDDGAEATLRRCSDRSRLDLVLNGGGLSRADRRAGNIVYVNAWFDWNRDGDWDDGSDGCASEWAIENLPIPASSLDAKGLRLLPVRFRAGKQVRRLWWRVTATLNEPVIDPGGRGRATPYARGETEDYFAGSLRGGGGGGPARFTARCVPNPAVISHGGTANVDFLFFGGQRKKQVYGKLLSARKGKGFGIALTPHANQQGVPPGFARMKASASRATRWTRRRGWRSGT